MCWATACSTAPRASEHPQVLQLLNVFLCVVITCFLIHAMMKRPPRPLPSSPSVTGSLPSCGIQTTYYKVMAFAFSAAFAGHSLARWSVRLLHRRSEPSTFGFAEVIEILVMSGSGRHGLHAGFPSSPLQILTILRATRSFDSYRMIIYSLVLILMMIFRPGGLLGRLRFLHEPHRGKGRERRAVFLQERMLTRRAQTMVSSRRSYTASLPAACLTDRDRIKSPSLDVRELGIDFGGLTARGQLQPDDWPQRDHRPHRLAAPVRYTVFNLLTNVYQPTRGSILIDEMPHRRQKKTYQVNRMGVARTFKYPPVQGPVRHRLIRWASTSP